MGGIRFSGLGSRSLFCGVFSLRINGGMGKWSLGAGWFFLGLAHVSIYGCHALSVDIHLYEDCTRLKANNDIDYATVHRIDTFIALNIDIMSNYSCKR
jgi:hypothetical protein